ncbi:glycosyltransferase, partial [Sutterella sp.]|uniref:glycosyltransferase n=1 Tax=Sutterella sp. TaxID=1981025 RepID=UPI0026DF66ED
MDQSLKSISPAFPEIKNSVVLTCDGNYLKFASVTIQSIIENNKNQHLDLIILASDINEWDKNSLLEQANNESISIRIIDISSIFKEIFGNFNLKSKKYWKLS